MAAGAAVVVIGVAGVLHIAGAPRSIDVIGRLSGSGSDDRFAQFDPREVQYVRDVAAAEPNSYTPEDTIFAYLEFRRTCRYLNRALAAAASTPAPTREAAVRSIMDPELARADVSASNHFTLKDTYHRMTDEMAAGDLRSTNDWIERECDGDVLTSGYVDRVDQ